MTSETNPTPPPAQEETTLALLDAWFRGDQQALVELVRSEAPWMRLYARKRLSARMCTFETSEDVVQSVMLNLLKAELRFRPENVRQFRALLARALYNRLCEVHDYVEPRERGRANCTPSQAPGHVLQLPSKDAPDRQLSENEEHAFVRLALQLLNPDDRRIILWRDFQNMPFAQIGEHLSMSEDGARSRHRRALARMKVQLENLKRGQTDALIREVEDVMNAPADIQEQTPLR
jgi:RNA polymerase sigma factor (sigma-70 family)